MRRVLKYATGDNIPEGARHIGSVVQTEMVVPGREVTLLPDQPPGAPAYAYTTEDTTVKCWLVWHYYEVEQ